ncbi:MAG TPA: AmmeMemoRadiSam system protein B [Methylomirabilota bacterium]|nr:AmmeMemoRadiSam system protein B [Methylomirabilota bacterium]
MSDAPRLRQIEAFPVDHEGQRFLALRDPAGYTPSIVMLPMPLLEIVSLFDGEHDIADIQAALLRHRGELVERARIEELARALDEHGFLESAAFVARRADVDRQFLEAPARPASHAGGAYPVEPHALRALMDGFFTSPAGPGAIDGAGAGRRPLRALVAPHIDFHRGGAAYAWGYRDVAERCDADLYVIFGTCHAGMPHPFALTRKPFDTPLGAAPVDLDVVEALAARARQDCFGAELAHRNEHSIEFQAVFLRYLFAGRRDVAIVPILTSFVHEALVLGRRPEDDARIPRFLDALAETLSRSGRRVAFVAAADLAHVGPRFGDAEPVSPEALARIRQEDEAMLRTVEAGDADAFFDNAARDGDARRVCGLSPVWTLLRATEGAAGELRQYGQWPDPQGVVTFASVVF